MQALLNELSIQAVQTRYEARLLIKGLHDTVMAGVEFGLENLLSIPSDFWNRELVDGYSTFSCISDIAEGDDVLMSSISGLFANGQMLEDLWLEENCSFDIYCDSSKGIAVTLAHHRNDALISLSTELWRIDPLVARLTIFLDGGNISDEPVLLHNFYSSERVVAHKNWIAFKSGRVLRPAYENPGHHDPASPSFRGGGSLTTLLPPDAAEVYRHATPADDLLSWWGMNDSGHLYRYQGSPGGAVHWNGTTDPNSARAIYDNDVPREIRRHFTARRS